MTFLSDSEIKKLINLGRLKISPFSWEQIRENGVDLTLGKEVAIPKPGEDIIDPTKSTTVDIMQLYAIREIPEEGLLLPPGSCILAHTREYIKMPNNVIALANLKSTLARIGFIIPPTVVDAGFEGQIVIEMCNMHHYIKLRRGMPFLHLVLARLDDEPEIPYQIRGHYHRQRGVRLADLPLKTFN